MSNHPNRNWRRVMRESASAHMARFRWPTGGVQAVSVEQLRKLLIDTYVESYTAGRESTREPRNDH
jgi:hypothetical protein